jgi:hypothetical protein
MKQYKILKSFRGRQSTDSEPESFTANTVVALSDELAKAAGSMVVEAKPGKVEDRETKVEAPAETKTDDADAEDGEPAAEGDGLDDLSFEELKELAKERGLTTFFRSKASILAALRA